MTSEITIVGCGYVGARVAAQERARGAHVRALSRFVDHSEAVQQLGATAITADLDDAQSLHGLDVSDQAVYYLAPPPASGVSDSRMRTFLAAVARRPPRRIVYISTTGVYGDCGGEWVNETRPVLPAADRAKRRVDAERELLAFANTSGAQVVILRVPGIYGPDRLPRERLEKRLPVLREDQAPWSNRIHVDDLVAACLAAMDRGANGAIYNVSDGNPTTMTDYFRRVATALALPPPPEISRVEAQDQIDPGMLS
ncbi:MAG: SDR family oxidoreductase, partial [Pseudomonadota bacterium]